MRPAAWAWWACLVLCLAPRAAAEEGACDIDTMARGRWVPAAGGPIGYTAPPCNDAHNRCDPAAMRAWVWRPDDCALPLLQRDDLLREFGGGKSVVFVGDSIIRQLYEYVNCSISPPSARYVGSEFLNDFDRAHAERGEIKVAGKGFRVLRPWKVSPDIRPKGFDPAQVRLVIANGCDQHWLGEADSHALKVSQPSGHHRHRHGHRAVVVRGLDDEHPRDLFFRAYFEGMRSALPWLRAVYPNATVVWVTVPVSHFKGFWFESGPEGECNATGPGPRANASRPANRVFAEMAARQAHVARAHGALPVDITAPSFARRDAHTQVSRGTFLAADCVHFCIPGVPDTWVRMIVHALRRARAAGA